MAELSDSTIPVVKNLLLLDSEGKRIAVKYYSSEWCAAGLLTWGPVWPTGGAEAGGMAAAPATRLLIASLPAVICRATVAQQAEFEKSVFAKTSRTNARGERELAATAVACRALLHAAACCFCCVRGCLSCACTTSSCIRALDRLAYASPPGLARLQLLHPCWIA